ncbi:AEC family transporter [Corynebacterium uberis]|uniref:AEC family transporter n=1 Tax=Corynebacterium TaxID=1716 RepID=UPI001D0BC736|nr:MULTISPECIES: AEC family transporter [Corynebacterium]MCZ9309485.1 AEC family transporter [Corynebacterium sp. c6VSa_13]UDL73035.1 AEC family transporter [Corynebacterium uberis]UDL76088.1 AEC family transporter [Corynebacterium uberis]UDL78300.1 AEC family transporter [Corynebacterium uberis]UDL80583.1 AEC family transporter [Corynebacterium uberis]
MGSIITGFAIIFAVIAVGYALGRAGVFSTEHERLVLNRVAFFAATPALMFSVVSTSEPETLFSPVFGVSVAATAVTATVFCLISALVLRQDLATTAAGAAASAWVNSNNIGLPVSIYVLGTGAYVPPILVFQMVILTPIMLAALGAAGSGAKVWTAIRGALFSPVVLASVAGVAVCLTGVTVPDPVAVPVEILGGASIPLILMSFGASLMTTRVLREPGQRAGVLLATGLKIVAMPLIATALGLACGLRDEALYACVILAALPTAQNVYNYAATYNKGTIVARDTVFLTTFASLPVMLIIALVFGR